jgi:hypothetical protein
MLTGGGVADERSEEGTAAERKRRDVTSAGRYDALVAVSVVQSHFIE